MTTNILATAAGLSDPDLLTRLEALAGRERQSSVELVAHLAALELRPSAYAARGYGSLFNYCTRALRLSEDAAYNRIAAARACRRFPAILDLLASGSLSLTSVRLVEPHLTPENCEDVLARAANRTRREVDALVAELAPRPDVRAAVRKVNPRTPSPPEPGTEDRAAGVSPRTSASESASALTLTRPPAKTTSPDHSAAALLSSPRPIIRSSAPQRYRVQFTIGEEAHEDLRCVQALLRREIPDGDPGLIFARAVRLLREKVEKEKLGAPRHLPTRPGTGRNVATSLHSRHMPAHVKRAVWARDGGQCAFVSPTGCRCIERTFLEFHHVQPFALEGPATVSNLSLRCRRHNQYEGELVFGKRAIRGSPATKGDRG